MIANALSLLRLATTVLHHVAIIRDLAKR